MFTMHNSGMTFEEIGSVFNISRQRAHQIYRNEIRNNKQKLSTGTV